MPTCDDCLHCSYRTDGSGDRTYYCTEIPGLVIGGEPETAEACERYYREGSMRRCERRDAMKWSQDGNMLCITQDTFVDLQQSPAVFIATDSEDGRCILQGGIEGLPAHRQQYIQRQLNSCAAGHDWAEQYVLCGRCGEALDVGALLAQRDRLLLAANQAVVLIGDGEGQRAATKLLLAVENVEAGGQKAAEACPEHSEREDNDAS